MLNQFWQRGLEDSTATIRRRCWLWHCNQWQGKSCIFSDGNTENVRQGIQGNPPSQQMTSLPCLIFRRFVMAPNRTYWRTVGLNARFSWKTSLKCNWISIVYFFLGWHLVSTPVTNERQSCCHDDSLHSWIKWCRVNRCCLFCGSLQGTYYFYVSNIWQKENHCGFWGGIYWDTNCVGYNGLVTYQITTRQFRCPSKVICVQNFKLFGFMTIKNTVSQ